MNNTQQQKITRWLIILGILIVGLIVVSLVIPPQDNSGPEAVAVEEKFGGHPLDGQVEVVGVL